MSARPTLGQVLRPFLASPAAALRLWPHQGKTLRALAACRTAALGGQAFYCSHCRREHVVAHSCRYRHCPHCQGAQAVDWLARQWAWLLPVPYFHLVFTLPHTLNGLIRQNRALLFKLLFDAASRTLLEFGAQRLDAQLGITAVLHTWSQTLIEHYHLHGIVTGGGVARDHSRWVATSPHYLFAVRALSRLFRGKYLAGLNTLFTAGKLEFHGALQETAAPGKFATLLRAAAQGRAAENDDAGHGGVRAPLLPAHPARALCEDPALRAAGPPPAARAAGARAPTPGHHRTRHPRSARRPATLRGTDPGALSLLPATRAGLRARSPAHTHLATGRAGFLMNSRSQNNAAQKNAPLAWRRAFVSAARPAAPAPSGLAFARWPEHFWRHEPPRVLRFASGVSAFQTAGELARIYFPQ